MTTPENRPSTIKSNIDKLMFKDTCNFKKLNYYCNNWDKYEEKIGKVVDKSKNNKYDAQTVVFNFRDNIIISNADEERGYVKVSYKKGKNSKNSKYGRYFAKHNLGIQSLPRKIRHSICDGFSFDVDIVNAQPSLLYCISKKYDIICPFLKNYIENRDDVIKKYMDEYDVSKDIIKDRIIAVMNGGECNKYTSFKPFFDEVENIFKTIYHNTEYDDIYKEALTKSKTKEEEGEFVNLKGSFMSLLLQTAECECLENMIEYLEMKGYITDNCVSLIFDGCQVPKDPTPILLDTEKYILEQTGNDIKLKVKPFDEKLELPDDYADDYADTNDDKELLVDKYKNITHNFEANNFQMFESIVRCDGDHSTIADLCYKFFGDTIKYDTNVECWFYCNIHNIWQKDKKCLILAKMIPKIISKMFISTSMKYNSMAYNEEEGPMKDLFVEKAKKSLKIAAQLCNAPFVGHILKMCVPLFAVDDFYEKSLDSKGYLFAFKNKVFDFNTNQLREIKPKDYIMTNTGYNYTEIIDEKHTEFFNKYFDTLFPDTATKDYVLDSFASILNGNKTEQYFNIFTGSGSNSKSTLINLYSSILGDYACNVSAETFTKPKRNANDTGELYKCKGKRGVFANEPESNEDNKLQTPILKRVADECNQTMICRALYSNPIEFKIQFTLIVICNNKPELSSVDGGIARRLRMVDFKVKFIDEPDVNNKYQAKLDPSFMHFMKDEGVRNAFITMLIDRWTNRVSKFPKIPVPECVMEASKEYIDDSNPVLGFIQEYYEITNNVNDKVKSSDLFQDFQYTTRMKTITTKRFKDDMLGIGIESKRLNTGVCFVGIKKVVQVDEE